MTEPTNPQTIEELQTIFTSLMNGTRPLREDLTPQERERFEKYGPVEFTSAGTSRKR